MKVIKELKENEVVEIDGGFWIIRVVKINSKLKREYNYPRLMRWISKKQMKALNDFKKQKAEDLK